MKKLLSVLLSVLMVAALVPAGLGMAAAETSDSAADVTLCGFAGWKYTNGYSPITFPRSFLAFGNGNPNAVETMYSMSGKDSNAAAIIGDTLYVFAHDHTDDSDYNTSETLYRINTSGSSWSSTAVGTGSRDMNVAALTYAQDTDTLYALVLNDDDTSHHLMTVDRNSGTLTELFDLADHDIAIIPSMTYIGNGQFFAVHHETGKGLIFNTSGQIVRRMNIATVNTQVESLNALYYYAPGNVIYGSMMQELAAGNFGVLISIDPATGAAVELGTMGYGGGYGITGLFALPNHTVNPDPHATQEEFNAAVNAAGSSLSILNDSQNAWQVVTDSGRTYARSTIQGVNYGKTSVSAVFHDLKAGQVLSFDWSVSSENGYDWLTFTANSSIVQRISGSHGFETYRYTVPANGTYTFKWTYAKDEYTSSGSDTACLDNVSISGNQPEPIVFGEQLDEALNVSGGSIEFCDDPVNPWVIDSSESGRLSIMSNVIGDSEHQLVYFRIRDAHAGDAVRFDWRTNCEDGQDRFVFRRNKMIISWITGDTDWSTYTYIIPADGDYFFAWDFTKDDDNSSEYDIGTKQFEDGNVWLDNVEFIREYGEGYEPNPNFPDPNSFNAALNAPGENRSFQNDLYYPWQIANDGSRMCAVSDIANLDNQETAFTLDMGYLEAGTTISFDWKTDCEAGHDRVSVTLNGYDYKVASGQTAWTNDSITVLSSDYYVIGWSYSKNHEISAYSDRVWVDNFKVTPVVTLTYHTVTIMDGFDNSVLRILNVPDGHYVVCPEPPIHLGYEFDHWEGQIDNITSDGVVTAIYVPRQGSGIMGDVNGDGVVNIVDATSVMRHAMSLLHINANYVQYADMDGDGAITFADGVIIMRIALGV